MVKDAEKFAAEDAAKKEKAEVMNQADTLLYSSEKTLVDAGDKITADQKDRINKDMEVLREAQKTGDIPKIKSGQRCAHQDDEQVATVLYQQAQQQHASSGEGGEATADENVEEADYEVIDEDESK